MYMHKTVSCSIGNTPENYDSKWFSYWGGHLFSATLTAVTTFCIITSRLSQHDKILSVMLTLLVTPTLAEDSEEQVAELKHEPGPDSDTDVLSIGETNLNNSDI